jgi:hypothetical protein
MAPDVTDEHTKIQVLQRKEKKKNEGFSSASAEVSHLVLVCTDYQAFWNTIPDMGSIKESVKEGYLPDNMEQGAILSKKD